MNKINSLFIKITLIMLPLVILLEVVVLTLTYNITYDNNLTNCENRLHEAVKAVVQLCEAYDLEDSSDKLQDEKVFDEMCGMFGVTYIFVESLDTDKATETYKAIGFGKEASEEAKKTRYPGVTVENALNDLQIAAYKGNIDAAILHDKTMFGDSLVCYLPCTRYFDTSKLEYKEYYQPYLIGTEISLDEVNRSFQSKFVSTIILVISMTLVMLLIFTVILYFMVTKPVRLISSRMSSFITDREKGVEKLPVKGHDELAQMADSFNTMTDEINRYIDDIDALSREKHTQEAELNIARSIQKGLLRPEHTDADTADIRAYMLPAKNVGGDLYDYYEAEDGRIYVSIADVSGKGISAALFMSHAITLLHQYAKMNYTPSQSLAEYNNTLVSQNSGGLFITTFLAIYDPATGELTYSNAGHNIPYILSDTLIPLKEAHGVAAGLFEGEEYENAVVRLKPGDTLFLYTDGVNEAKNLGGAFYSTERLEEKLTACIRADSEDIIKDILSDLNSFTKGASQNDDVTMLSLLIKPQPDETVLRLTSEPAQLRLIKEAIFSLNIGEDMKRTVFLAAEEMFVNICSYAYDTEGDVEVRLAGGDRVRLAFYDSGKRFDPTADLLDIDEYDHDNSIGGLGRFLTFSIADEYRYEYRDGKNILTLYFNRGDRHDSNKNS